MVDGWAGPRKMERDPAGDGPRSWGSGSARLTPLGVLDLEVGQIVRIAAEGSSAARRKWSSGVETSL
jgi:hypothetical protein